MSRYNRNKYPDTFVDKENIMDRLTLIRKLEEGIASMREQLDQNDGSALAALAGGVKTGFQRLQNGFDSLKADIMDNEKAQKTLDSFKGHMDDFEKAVKEGDKKLSAKLLALMEKAVSDLKEKQPKA